MFYRKTAGNDRCTDVSGPEDVRDPRDLPPLAILPANPIILNGDIDTNTAFEPKFNIIKKQLILGKSYNSTFLQANPEFIPIEDTDGEERYYAQVTGGDLVITDGESLLSDGKAKVIIIVSGNLDISGNGGNVFIGNTSDEPLKPLNTPPEPAFYAPSNFLEIYVTGDVKFSGTGTFYVNGLIRANGTVKINGDPTINLRGSIWAEDWDSGGGTVNIIRDAGYDDYKYYSITPQRTPKPLTYAPTGWEQQEAD